MKGFNFNMFCTIKRRKVWVQLLKSHCNLGLQYKGKEK